MIDEKNFMEFMTALEEAGAEYVSFDDLRRFIDSQPKIGEWIPCGERLPEEGQMVLATHEAGLYPNRKVIEHYFHDGKFLNNWDMDTDFKSPTFGQHYMGDVIAWQPLPEAYHEQVD